MQTSADRTVYNCQRHRIGDFCASQGFEEVHGGGAIDRGTPSGSSFVNMKPGFPEPECFRNNGRSDAPDLARSRLVLPGRHRSFLRASSARGGFSVAEIMEGL